MKEAIYDQARRIGLPSTKEAGRKQEVQHKEIDQNIKFH